MRQFALKQDETKILQDIEDVVTSLATANWEQLKTQLEQAESRADRTDEAAEKSETTEEDKKNDKTIEQMKLFMKNLVKFATTRKQAKKKEVAAKPKEDCAPKTTRLMNNEEFYSLYRVTDL